jgi:hypothetical protein
VSKKRLSPVAINIWVWIGLTALVAVFGSASVLKSSSISRHAQTTQASVVALVPEQHQSFDYRYRVGTHTFLGRSTAGDADRSFESMRVGDTVTIFYDSTHPEQSTAGPPDMAAIETIGGLIALCAIIPLVLMFSLHKAHLLPYWKLFAPGS